MKKIITCFLLFALGYACHPDPEKGTENTIPVEVTDTLINLTVNGIGHDYTVKKSTDINFKDFQLFLNDYSVETPELNDTIREDITGDGIKDKVITQIKVVNNNCVIYASIYDRDSLIYADTLEINEDYTFKQIWNSDSVYYKLKPHSTFYTALFNRYIIDDLNPEYESYNYWIDFFLENQKNNFLTKKTDTLLIQLKLDSIKNELLNYKGKLVFSMHQLDRDIYIWDRNKKKFVDFYQP